MGASYDGRSAAPVSAVRLTAAQADAIRGARLLLRQHDRADLGDVIAARMRLPETPLAVVVGEAKRGKSSLVNALLGRRNLAPVGTDVTTAAFVQFRCGAEADRAVAVLADGGQRELPLAELADWVVTGGGAGGADAVEIVVDVATERLPGVVLVDTPGAGGLHGGHARLAVQAARRAAVLVFVADSGQPLSAPELEFLAEAAGTVEDVVIVLTKTDVHPAYQTIIDEDRALLVRHLPRFAEAPIVAVSSELAQLAASVPAELAAQVVERSGVGALAAHIEQRLADRRALTAANVLRTVDYALGELAADLQLRVDAGHRGPGGLATVEQQRAELVRLREHQSSWTLYLDRDLREARSHAVDRLVREADALRARWRERLDTRRRAYTQTAADDASVALRADLAAMAVAVGDTFRESIAAIVRELLGPERAVELVAAAAPADPARAAGELGREAPRGLRKVLDPTMLMISGSAGSAGAGLAASISGAAFAGAAAAVAGPIVGLGALAVLALHRQGLSAQRRLVEWAVEEINRARTAILAELDALVNVLKPEIVVAYRAELAGRIARMDAAVKEAQSAQRTEERERKRREQELELQLEAVRTQRAEVAALLAKSREHKPPQRAPIRDRRPTAPTREGTGP
jgi:hypothetical protein